MEMAYAEYSEKKFKIKYDNKIYLLKRGLFKSKISEVFPEKYMIAEFYNYDDLFSKSIINDKLLWEIWDNCELVEKRIKVLEKGRGGAVAKVISEKRELDEILQIAQENLKKEGKRIIDKSYHGYHEFSTLKR